MPGIIDLPKLEEMLQVDRVPLRPDYMSQAGPVSRAASLCRDDFQPCIT